jgi:hypothetical protein
VERAGKRKIPFKLNHHQHNNVVNNTCKDLLQFFAWETIVWNFSIFTYFCFAKNSEKEKFLFSHDFLLLGGGVDKGFFNLESDLFG